MTQDDWQQASLDDSSGQPQPLEYQSQPSPLPGEPAPWFGYIGFGIVIAAMLLGFAGMVLGALWFVRWAS